VTFMTRTMPSVPLTGMLSSTESPSSR
jgi:hypothetical protein